MYGLNFQHLRYFWVTAREGSLTRAAERLSLAPSTVSAQIKTLEENLGHDLFVRRGRGLALTERGVVVKDYADEIFGLGRELVDAVQSEKGLRHAYRLRVGVTNDLPKLVISDLLMPSTAIEDFPVHLAVREDRPDALVAGLAVHHFDLVLTDHPVGLSSDVHAESAVLGETSVTFMAAPDLAARVLRDFPHSLHGEPVLLPEPGSTLRRLMEEWFERHRIHPRIALECGDSALMASFGQDGIGAFPVATAVRSAVQGQYRVLPVGELPDVVYRFYAHAMPGRLSNPAVAAVLQGSARRFGSPEASV